MKDNSKNKVLIVEDEKTLLDMYSLKLTKESYQVITAMDGEAGLNLAKQEQPDIILLDVMLPKFDGFRVLEELRKLHDFKKTPIIMLTNLGQKEDMEKGKQFGATDYLVKASCTPAQVAAKVESILKK